MPKVKRKRVGDVGIRLKPVETNLLENYNEFSKRRKKTRKKKKKIKKPKRTVTKSVEIQPKIDPLYKIMEESKGKPKEEIEVKEMSDEDKPDEIKKPDIDKPKKEIDEQSEEPVFKKIQVHEGKADITKKDPNIKSLSITVSTEPERKKVGAGIILE